MNICYITQAGFDKHSADSSHAAEVIQAFLELGHDVFVLHGGSNSQPERWGAKARHPPMWLRSLGRIGFQIWLIASLRHVLAAGTIDFVYVRHASLMVAPALVCQRRATRLITESNTIYSYTARQNSGRLVSALVKRFEGYSLRSSSRVVAISEPLKRELLALYKLPKGDVCVIGNGCNTARMRVTDGKITRQRYGIDSQALVIGFVGHLHPWQGVSELIDAFAIHCVSDPRSVLMIVGGGELFDHFKQKAKDTGLTRNIVLTGAVDYDEVAACISCFDVAVAPGEPGLSFDYRIRSPLKIFEYMACGKPVVAGRLEALEPLFSTHDIGRLIEPGHVKELARALSELTADRDQLKHTGENARQVAESELTWRTVAKKIIDAAADAA